MSRVVGEKLIDAVAQWLLDIDFSVGSAYLIDDFSVTKAALDAKHARAISFLDEDLDCAKELDGPLLPDGRRGITLTTLRPIQPMWMRTEPACSLPGFVRAFAWALAFSC